MPTFNFQAQNNRELSFKKGDLIYIKRQVDSNWYEGERNAVLGIFPTTYVEILPVDPSATPLGTLKSTTASTSQMANKSSSVHREGQLVLISLAFGFNFDLHISGLKVKYHAIFKFKL